MALGSNVENVNIITYMAKLQKLFSYYLRCDNKRHNYARL